jgi:plasmid stabilization system protein ParE
VAFGSGRAEDARAGEPSKNSGCAHGELPQWQEQADLARGVDAPTACVVKSLPVVALPEVEGDLRAAILHYSSWRSDSEAHVLNRYDETISWIEWNPEAFPKKYGAVRRAILKRSYYIIYFLIEADRSIVLAVLDGRRNPTEIRSLVAGRKRRTPRVLFRRSAKQDS